MGRSRQRALLFRSRQAAISMRFRAGLPGTKLTFLSWLSTTSGALHCQCFLLGDSHGYILHVYSAARWSILTIALALHVPQQQRPTSQPGYRQHRVSMRWQRLQPAKINILVSTPSQKWWQAGADSPKLCWLNRNCAREHSGGQFLQLLTQLLNPHGVHI